MEKPLVSVILPICEEKSGVFQAIDSVFSQTYSNFELIIIDDSGDEETYTVLETMYGEKQNLIYVLNEERLGYFESCNVGVSYASGEYIVFLKNSFVWETNKLEIQINQIMDEYSGGNVIYSTIEKNYQNGVTRNMPSSKTKRELCIGYMYPLLLLFPIVDIGTLMLKKSVYEEVGGIQAHLGVEADYEFLIRLAKYHVFDFVDKALVRERIEEKDDDKKKEEVIFLQCYIIGLHYKDLINLGQLEDKLNFVNEQASRYKCNELFVNCLESLELPEINNYIRKLQNQNISVRKVQEVHEKNIDKIELCCGCMSCVNACKVGAIKMFLDKDGFWMPRIEKEKCVECGKCKSVCPMCNEVKGVEVPEECLAAMGSDEVRAHSSSGGIFPLLAETVLQDGGYVAGAIFDEEFEVKHIITNELSEVKKMYSSKYVQSYIGDLYVQVEQILKRGKKVLFSGCACQAAGLQQYLQYEYSNLYIIDVVCHGVPSVGVYRSYLREKGAIKNISFRDKSKLGWASGLVMNYADGKEEIYPVGYEPYMVAYLNNWILRESCFDCQFKSKKYSDITLGDFWGINQEGAFEDGKGSSFVTLNTSKGVALFRTIFGGLKNCAKATTQLAVKYNPCIVSPVKHNKLRDVFFECYDCNSLQMTIGRMKEKIRFDAALIYMWANNYGNALTNYALYMYLSKQGMRLLALDNMSTLRPEKDMLRFAREHYNLSSEYFSDYAYGLVNDCCERFIVGSDQNWNYLYESVYKYGKYFQLNFVKPEKRKYSYATSFGTPHAAIPKELGKELYQQFDAISVREDFGVDVCKELYESEAIRVMDPVFLLEQEEYEEILANQKFEYQEPYILVYVLNPTYEKVMLCQEIQRKLGGIRIINILDNNAANIHYNKKMFNYENIVGSPSVEEWLNFIKHSSFVITDSYHGMCFSIIYRKPFVTIKNRERYRFATFERYPVFAERILDNLENQMIDKWVLPIDYSLVEEQLNEEIACSKRFIRDNILV